MDYPAVDESHVAQNQAPRKLSFNQITLEKLIVAQHHEAFFAEKLRRLNVGVRFPFKLDENGVMVRTFNTDHQSVALTHSNSLSSRLSISRSSSVTPADANRTKNSSAVCTGLYAQYIVTRPCVTVQSGRINGLSFKKTLANSSCYPARRHWIPYVSKALANLPVCSVVTGTHFSSMTDSPKYSILFR